MLFQIYNNEHYIIEFIGDTQIFRDVEEKGKVFTVLILSIKCFTNAIYKQ